MPSFRDPSEVAAELSDRDLPFPWYVMGPEGSAIKFEVDPLDMAAVTNYSAQHPLALSDGTSVPVLVESRRSVRL